MSKATFSSFARIDEATARALYDAGQPDRVFLCPVNLDPCNSWALLQCYSAPGVSWSRFVTLYERFNCGAVAGRRAAFYIRREVVT